MRTVSVGALEVLCPFDCSGQGTCPQVLAPSEFEEDTMSADRTWSNADDALRCTCTEEDGRAVHAGRFCEAASNGVNPSRKIQLSPGKWQAHQYDIVDDKLGDLSIELTVLPLPPVVSSFTLSWACSDALSGANLVECGHP